MTLIKLLEGINLQKGILGKYNDTWIYKKDIKFINFNTHRVLFYFCWINFFNVFLILVFILTSYEWYKLQKNNLFFILGLIFLLLSFFSAYLLRGSTLLGLIYFLMTLLICISTDIGGYSFGKIFKGPKLTKVSPNKTFSGVIGSYFLSYLFIFLYFKYLDNKFLNLIEINFFSLLTITFLISSISQLGDLTISFFKRKSQIKDTSKLIPGHGGLLDRIDGVIFAIPFSYILLKII